MQIVLYNGHSSGGGGGGDLNALVAFSNGMQAIKNCSNKMLQFLPGVPTNTGRPV